MNLIHHALNNKCVHIKYKNLIIQNLMKYIWYQKRISNEKGKKVSILANAYVGSVKLLKTINV